MELALLTYFVLQLNTFNGVLFVSAFLSFFLSLILFFGKFERYCKECKEFSERNFKTAVKVFLTSTILFVIIPGSENAKYILGAYGVQKAYTVVTESEDVKRVASKSLLAIEGLLDNVNKEKKEGK